MLPKEINNIVDLVKTGLFWSKSDENLLTKATHLAKVANFFWNGFVLCMAEEGSIKNT